jgi:hypothetical protein
VQEKQIADEECNLVETSRRLMDSVPDEVVNFGLDYNKSAPEPVLETQEESGFMLAATTSTAHVRIYELDCCGIPTISLETDHAWSWTSTTASLSGNGNTVADWCCYWWHLTSGPSKSHGAYSSSHVYAHGTASFVCYGSDPVPFCLGQSPRYPMTFNTWLQMYNTGAATASGTSYSGTVIPLGSVVFQFWIS